MKSLKANGYDAWEYVNKDPELKAVVNSFTDGTFSTSVEEFKTIYDELMFRNDEYFLLADFKHMSVLKETIQRFNH